jgi:hypothetical protein
MKTEAGWSAATLVAVAALVGVTSQSGGRGAGDSPAARGPGTHSVQTSLPNVQSPFERGPCVDLEGKLQTFLLASPEYVAAPSSCYDERTEKARSKDKRTGEAGAKALRNRGGSLQFMIAIVPDPLHTHFSLSFDRLAEAIQQGAQDEHYLYDSSWMPWETEEPSLVLLADQDKLDDRKKAREEQPGILLFRKAEPGKNPYAHGLIVFVVGEEATSGIHKEQFQNAVGWIAALRQQGGAGSVPVKIIGPTFSGSLASLAQLLTERSLTSQISNLYGPGNAARLPIYSGGITSEGAVRHFGLMLKSGDPGPIAAKITFRSFQESDETAIWRYRSYLHQAQFDISRLAILSEDETAFGGYAALEDNPTDPLCGTLSGEGDEAPACLYYPRDISALRDAYQKQSIFNSGSSQSGAEAAQHTLSTNIADPEGQQHDAIRSYSGNQTPLSQEAVLQQVVSMLRVHRSEYVVIRSSNPLDQLFLSHYLRLAYPEGRVVIQGADLLLRRESGAATLSGIMTLTTYPLLPWEQHWSRIAADGNAHSHKVFAQDTAEGTYIAMRALLEGQDFEGTCSSDVPGIRSGGPVSPPEFLPPNCGPTPIRDYLAPWWASPRCLAGDGKCPAARRPSTWVSVLGRGGFWPVAALNESTVPPPPAEWKAAGTPSWVQWPPVPLSMKICLGVILLLAIMHLICCSTASLTVKPGYRAHFVRIPGWSHPALILFGSVALASIPTLVAWGLGAMSQHDETVPQPWTYWCLLAAIWGLTAAAVWMSSWNEQRLALKEYPGMKGPLAAWHPWLRLLIFLTAASAFYLLVDRSLEGALDAADRVPAFWRAMNLTNGVSPLTPLLALAAGLYFWFWYSLQGLALFGESRPLLPRGKALEIEWPDKSKHQFLSMYSGERIERPLESLCEPFSGQVFCVFAGSFVLLLLLSLLLADGEIPVRSLGATHYARFYCIGMDLLLSLILASSWQLMKVWFRLRQLLVFLDRIPLRRTMCALKGYSWGSVWKMGGNILDVRYKLLYRQFESFTHMCNSMASGSMLDNRPWSDAIKRTHKARGKFADWYSEKWDDWEARDLRALRKYQHSLAESAGLILSKLLVPRWREEDQSLVMEDSNKKSVTVEITKDESVLLEASAAGKDQAAGANGEDGFAEVVRNAEELVCLVYLGFVQNILGRMRTLVMQIALLFVAATASVATYPFDPRPALSGAMLAMFLTVGFVIVIVYSQMCRDATLSHVTNTNPGELGAEFWFKLIGFGVGPALGLLATIFPELPGSLLAWLQPGASVLK